MSRRVNVVIVSVVCAMSSLVLAQTPPAPAAGRGGIARPEPYDFNDHAGWVSIFDGTLKDWDANPAVWSVQNGAVTAASTAERRIGTSYVIWKGGELADFELKLEFKLEGDVHSGIAYRNWLDPARGATLGPAAPPPASAGAAPPGAGAGQRAAGAPGAPGAGRAAQPPPDVPAEPRWTLYGPGLDYDADRRNSGNVEERGTARRSLAPRGSVVLLQKGVRPRVVGTIGDPDALMDVMKVEDWNQVHIIARGRQIIHIINGRVMTIAIDDDDSFFTPKGLIGWSIEQFGTGRVNVRSIWLKKL
jgi:hypothetical protein